MYKTPEQFVAPFNAASEMLGHVTIMSDCAGQDPEADLRADWLCKRALGVGIFPRNVGWKPLSAALGCAATSWLGMAGMFGSGKSLRRGRDRPELFCTNAAPRLAGNPHGCQFLIVRVGNQFWMSTYTPGPLSELACPLKYLVQGQVWQIRLEVFLKLLAEEGREVHIKNFRSAHMTRVFAELLADPGAVLECPIDLASVIALPDGAVRWVDQIEQETATGTVVKGRNIKVHLLMEDLLARGWKHGDRIRVTIGGTCMDATFSPQLGTDSGVVIAQSSSPGDLSGNSGVDLFEVNGWLAEKFGFPAIGTPVDFRKLD